MTKLDVLTQFILPLLLSYFGYLYGRRKDKAETKKLQIETEKEEIDVMDRTVEFYKTKMAEMLDEIEDLKKQISELKEMIESLVSNQCLGEHCQTKIEYNKIMTKRAARKRNKNTQQ